MYRLHSKLVSLLAQASVFIQAKRHQLTTKSVHFRKLRIRCFMMQAPGVCTLKNLRHNSFRIVISQSVCRFQSLPPKSHIFRKTGAYSNPLQGQAPSLSRKYWIRVDVAGTDLQSILLQCIINYIRKKLYCTAP